MPNFNLSKYERPGLTQDEVEEIKEAFDLFDTTSSGEVDKQELIVGLRSLGFDAKNSSVDQITSELHAHPRASLTFSEFVDLMTARFREKESREDVEKVFRLFDDDNSGSITVAKLQRVCKELGERMSADEIQEMIDRADPSGNMAVSLDDFCHVMTKKTFPQP